MPKFKLRLCSIFILAGSASWMSCSPPIEGLWIEKSESALLYFHGDSVINNSLITSQLCGTFGYRITKDSLTWVGVDPRYNHGKTSKSFRYRLEGDSLRAWYGGNPMFETVYFKSNAKTFHDYFFKRPELTINLPGSVVNSKTFGYLPDYILDVVIGFKDGEVTYYFQGIETNMGKID